MNLARYGYQLVGKGRWNSFILRKPKAKEGTKKKKQPKKKRNMEQDSGDEAGRADDENYDLDIDGANEVRVVICLELAGYGSTCTNASTECRRPRFLSNNRLRQVIQMQNPRLIAMTSPIKTTHS